ncbi:MAG TPA: hypothetical protein PKD51_17115 [Saprospiraceae bacterium]|nr:hypothetical protein [Saprospiraceae bacterium]
MQENEVIIVDKILPDIYMKLAYQAARYAIISSAFTYDRMDKNDIQKRIINITKGKLAEGLLYFFCNENQITLDHQSCSTPFWMADFRDFLYKNGEWDVKNNFIYASDKTFDQLLCTNLPTLVPNKNTRDQWSKKDKLFLEYSKFGAYLFTFMRIRPDQKDFFKITFTGDQLKFLEDISHRFHNTAHSKMPFLESWFWEEIPSFDLEKQMVIHYYPELIITACANPRYWHLYLDTGPTCAGNNYLDIHSPHWYEVINQKFVRFMSGIMATTITNKTCPVSLLPSFYSLHPHLAQSIKYGRCK